MKLTRTPYKIMVAKHNGYPVYRTVYESDGHYFIRYGGKLINVDQDMEDHNYSRKEQI